MPRPYKTIISAGDLNENLARPDWVVLDCRTKLGVAGSGLMLFERGHIPGACHIDLETDMSSPITEPSGRHPLPDAGELSGKLRARGVNNSSQIVCYDDLGGAFAARMWWLMKWLGHDAVCVLDGGIQHWEALGHDLLSEPITPEAGEFSGRPNRDMWVDIDGVCEALADGNTGLLDARTRARFTAEDRLTDPVPGHIPGAHSYPYSENLDENGRFKSPDALRKRFERTGDRPAISMCGSGVTGCHNMLAMTLAGLPMGRLYVGSWSEWIRDENRPVATGDGQARN